MTDRTDPSEEVIRYCEDEDIKFIRLAFCDVFGRQKNVSIMPSALKRAFSQGIAFDGSAVRGFGNIERSDLFLFPDPETLTILPWRPEEQRVARMYCTIGTPKGEVFPCDMRSLLIKAADTAREKGIDLRIGFGRDFRLFKADENGKRTDDPFDLAEIMDTAPSDGGENIRRNICLTLEKMGVRPLSSFHKEGCGQNELILSGSDPVRAADNLLTFETVVKNAAGSSGLYADLSLGEGARKGMPYNRCRIIISAEDDTDGGMLKFAAGGIMKALPEIMRFIRVPEEIYYNKQDHSDVLLFSGSRIELLFPLPQLSPYIVLTLLMYACIEGVESKDAGSKTGFVARYIPERLRNICDSSDIEL